MKLSQLHNKSKTCLGQYHHDTSTAAMPCTMEVMALAVSCLPMSFSYLLHHMLVEIVVELYGSVALPSVAEVDEEILLICLAVETEGSASVPIDEGC
jgi:hypothetical protein